MKRTVAKGQVVKPPKLKEGLGQLRGFLFFFFSLVQTKYELEECGQMLVGPLILAQCAMKGLKLSQAPGFYVFLAVTSAKNSIFNV